MRPTVGFINSYATPVELVSLTRTLQPPEIWNKRADFWQVVNGLNYTKVKTGVTVQGADYAVASARRPCRECSRFAHGCRYRYNLKQ